MYVCLRNLCKELTALVFKITVVIVSVIWFLNIMEDFAEILQLISRDQ